MDQFPGPCVVLLHVGLGPSQLCLQGGTPPPVTERFSLRDDLWIEQLPEPLATAIQRACDPPHYNIDNYVHDRHLYAFVRRLDNFEPAEEGVRGPFALAALSRLAHPTSIGHRYWPTSISALTTPPSTHCNTGASAPTRSSPNKIVIWLSIADATVLRDLLPWLSRCMHKRVHRAYWNHEYAMRTVYLDQRWTLVVSGLEALTSVGKQDTKRQFCQRMIQLAKELQHPLTQDELEAAYDLRSKLVHAEAFLSDLEAILPETEHHNLYTRLEGLLRVTVRSALLDEEFGNTFRDGDAVIARWPFQQKGPRRRS